jgi:sialic acid synthase SpsE
MAAGVGADYVKFQSWQIARLRDPSAEPFYDWIRNAELSDDMHRELIEECRAQNLRFLTTAFDEDRLDFLASLGLDAVKIASPDAANLRLLERAKGMFPHLIVSTGMHRPDEIARAAEMLKGCSFTFMHCVSLYPHDLDHANLSRLAWLRQFTPSVGFSDHSRGIEAAKMAAVLGAAFVERHACLSRYGPGRVNAWDSTPEEWEALVRYVDQVPAAMGAVDVPLSEAELRARARFIGRWSGPAEASGR